MYLCYQQDGLPMARWHAVTGRLSCGSPLAEGGHLSFCPEEVTKSSPSSKWMQAYSTTCVTSQERGHRPTPSFTCKCCLKISAYIMALRQEQCPMSSCSLAECGSKALGAGNERLSVHNCTLIQWPSTHQLWLSQVGSNTSGPSIPPCHPQECASGRKRH